MKLSYSWALGGMLLAQGAFGSDMTLIGPHPTSVLTAYPALFSLKAHEGRIYMGYGAWGDFPVAVVVSYDPASNVFRIEYSAPTDSLDHFRTIGEKLYAPSIDPIHYEGFQDFSVREGTRWLSFTPVGLLHAFDTGTATGSDLWVVGSKLPTETPSTGGAVIRSVDGGRTWKEVTPAANSLAQFYYGFSLRGRFYVQGYVYDGDIATPHPAPHTNLRALQVGNGTNAFIVGLAGRIPGFNDYSPRPLVTFDSLAWRTLMPSVEDFTVEGDSVYALMSTQVWRGNFQSVTQAVWEPLPITVPTNARSIEVAGGICYVGDATGNLWAARLDGTLLESEPARVINELPDAFGRSMALCGGMLAVGAPDYSGAQYMSGQVTVWEQTNSAWVVTATLDPPQPSLSGWFGRDIALNDRFLAVLESGKDETGRSRGSAARVHLYQRNMSGWQLRQSFTNAFAHSVALYGQRLAIGTSTRLFVYWLSETNLPSAVLEANLSHNTLIYEPIGRVAMDDRNIAYGLAGDPSRSGTPGQVNIYEKNAQGTWTSIASLRRDAAPLPAGFVQRPDAFGFSVSLNNGWLAVGAPRDDTIALQAGAVHLYERVYLGGSTTYIWRQTLLAPVAQREARFGWAVSLAGSRLLVGAPGVDTLVRQGGRVFVYDLAGTNWVATGEIPAPESAEGQFGWEVLAMPGLLFAGCQSAQGSSVLEDRVAIATGPDTSQSVDLSVTQTVSQDVITNETLLTYSITVTNGGPSPAGSVSLAFTRSGTLQIESFVSSGLVCTNTGTEVLCTLPQLLAGASESLTIHGRAGLLGSCALIQAEAAAYAQEADLNIQDNRATTLVSSSPPEIRIVSPVDGTNVSFRGSVQISTEASGLNSIASVSIYTNDSLLRTFNNPPYTHTWSSIPPGAHRITVRALDTCGVPAVASRLVHAASNHYPQVMLLSPVGGTRFSDSTNHIPIFVSAFDPEGGRTIVEIYVNFTRLRVLLNPPFATVWSNAPNGIHALHAVAYDPHLAATTSVVARVRVGPDFSSGTNWVALNDHGFGPATSGNATRWDILGTSPGSAGVLRRATDGTALPVWLAITRSSPFLPGASGVDPDPNSPSTHTFGGQVDFASGSAANVSLSAANWVRYEFRGLDPNLRYNFKATAVVGNPAYTNRWTLVELAGARGSESAHTAGCLPEGSSGSIRSNQVALNTGFNLRGDMVGWDNIQPERDGALAIVCSQYTGDVPGGSSDGAVGYALTAVRIEEVNIPVPPSPTITRQPSSVTTSPGVAARFSAQADGAGPLRYQWLRNNTLIAGANSDSFELDSASTNDIGRFSVLVIGETGSTVSFPAVLTLLTLDVQASATIPESAARLTVFGPAAQNYAAEFSDVLSPSPMWNSLTNFILPTNKVTLVDPIPSNRPSRFYRVTPKP